jgi:hypothetical protein
VPAASARDVTGPKDRFEPGHNDANDRQREFVLGKFDYDHLPKANLSHAFQF